MMEKELHEILFVKIMMPVHFGPPPPTTLKTRCVRLKEQRMRIFFFSPVTYFGFIINDIGGVSPWKEVKHGQIYEMCDWLTDWLTEWKTSKSQQNNWRWKKSVGSPT